MEAPSSTWDNLDSVIAPDVLSISNVPLINFYLFI